MAQAVAVTWVMAQQAAKAARDAELKEVAGERHTEADTRGQVVPDPDQGGRAAGARGRSDGDIRQRRPRRKSSRAARASSCARWQARSRSASSASLPPPSSLAGLQLGWVAPTEGKQVALCVLAFTVPLQFTASIFGFLARDGVAATGMGLLSGIWAATGLVLLTAQPGATSNALGLFLLVAGVAMLAPASAAAASKLVPSLVLATAGLRFVLTGIYEISGSGTWKHVAGIVGLILAALALYAAYAAEYEDVLKRPCAPSRTPRQGARGGRGHVRPAGRGAHARARRPAAALVRAAISPWLVAADQTTILLTSTHICPSPFDGVEGRSVREPALLSLHFLTGRSTACLAAQTLSVGSNRRLLHSFSR